MTDNNAANLELLFVLAAMVVLFLLAVVAVVIFFRVWSRERRK